MAPSSGPEQERIRLPSMICAGARQGKSHGHAITFELQHVAPSLLTSSIPSLAVHGLQNLAFLAALHHRADNDSSAGHGPRRFAS